MKNLVSRLSLLLCPLFAVGGAPAAADTLPALRVSGANYIAPDGAAVKFWGANFCAFYPEHQTADAVAAFLAERQINLVRPHHLLRAAKDWNPSMTSGALLDYKADSRTFDPDALDRLDYFNAALRKHGIYLSMSAHNTRRFLPGDAGVIETTPEDAAAWSRAIRELNGWPSRKAFDPIKALPVIDERAARLTIEFITNLLRHRNPYTGLSYAEDPQWISLEVVNESSLEYAIICGNRFPAYFEERLQAKWREHAAKAGLADAGDVYAAQGEEAVKARAGFFRELESAYYDRVRQAVEATGAKIPMMFSNLWRGDNAAAMAEEKSDVIENHAYIDPLLVRDVPDGIAKAMNGAILGKPYFLGEFNQAEGDANIKAQAPFRTMLMLGAPAYAGLHDWSGVVWFAWVHGTKPIAADGRSVAEKREARLGEMVSDGMMLDHLRVAGLAHRRGLVAVSRAPMILATGEPYHAGKYNSLMDGKRRAGDGWQGAHGFRRTYASGEDSPAVAPWLEAIPGPVVTSDTGEIVKDTGRKQLTVTAPQFEGFSGYLDGQAPAGLPHLGVKGEAGFATVLLVAEDAVALKDSASLIVSRTGLDAALAENAGPAVVLRKVTPGTWSFTVTRPRAGSEAVEIVVGADGLLVLPTSVWHEAELRRRR